MHWYNLPSIVCMYTIIWDVKGYMVPIKCDGSSYIILLPILPLHRLKYKHITLTSLALYKHDLLCSLYVLTARHISRSLVTTKWQWYQ